MASPLPEDDFGPDLEQLGAIGGLKTRGEGYIPKIQSAYGSIIQNAPDYQYFTAPLSNQGRATATYGGQNNLVVAPDTPIRVVNNATGEVIYSGTGYEGAQAAIEAAKSLSASAGKKADWDIQVTRPGGTKFESVSTDRPDSALGEIGKIAGTILPLAMIPLTMGASAPLAGLGAAGNVALGAGVGAASAGLRGQDILKGAVMGGLTSAGGQFLSAPLKGAGLGVDAARAVGTGIGATAGGLATGQNLQNALLGGVAAGGTTYLGGKLFGPSQQEIEFQRGLNKLNADLMGDIDAFNIDAGDAFIKAYSPQGGGLTSGGANGVSFGQAPSAVIPSADLTVTGTRIGATPASSGSAPSFAVNVPTGGTPETIVTAQRQTPVAEQPSFAVNVPTQTPAVGGPDLEETVVTAQDEGLQQAEQPGFAVNTSGLLPPEIIATAQREAALTQEEPSLAVLPPATTTGPDTLVTGQREVPQVEQEPSFAALPPATTTGPDTLVTGQRETPVVEEKPDFAVMPPATTTGPDTLVTGQRETPLTEEAAAPVVLPPATTTGPDTLVTGQRETPVVKEEPSFAALPPATTTGPDTVVTGKREDVKLDDKEGVGGPYIPPKSDIVVTGDKGTPKFDDKGEYTGPLTNIPSLVDDAVQEELAGKKTEPPKERDIADYLKLLGLAIGLGGNIFGGGGGGAKSPGKYSSTRNLSSVFTDKLPTPGQGGSFIVGGLGGTAADQTFAARPVTDWYRYGMGPAMDIPEGADLSRATSPYAGYGPGTLGEETFKAVSGMSHGGSMGYSRGSSRESFAVSGPGTGRSDDIPAVLSDGEYVIDAETVALLGDGSSKAGAKKLDQMRVAIRKHKGKNLAKGKFSVNAKRPEAYMSGGRI